MDGCWNIYKHFSVLRASLGGRVDWMWRRGSGWAKKEATLASLRCLSKWNKFWERFNWSGYEQCQAGTYLISYKILTILQILKCQKSNSYLFLDWGFLFSYFHRYCTPNVCPLKPLIPTKAIADNLYCPHAQPQAQRPTKVGEKCWHRKWREIWLCDADLWMKSYVD